ncbi:CLAVATA3/ESR (CLE)-related protein TDIF [Morella rubra]|uniref:CLAVATA3/ESR (CLE)-related protein TDIF n=1 Tax=Morella rubra TaxID=262757 RepID=A0A6A1VDB7_9ROSI|nr:CLAVATA3/ESR (CLE)-related protein TDIF [Morella rubra]
MDFEPLWDLGGWLIFPNCMAVPKTSSSISEIHTKSHPFILFLAILFIFLLLINLSNTMNPSMASSVPVKRLLLDPSASAASTTTSLHPKQIGKRHTSPTSSTKREFGADAHEVPSGPNPISN